jgi:hypothetical protein
MALKTYDGSNQSIVVIDTGHNHGYKYPGEIVYQYDFADKDDDTYNAKSNHGSQVAQVASKEAAGADIIHLKVFGDGKWFAGGADIQDALQWTIDNAEKYNIAAVNMSLGYGNTTETSDTFLKDEFARLADKGVLTMTAAGNSYQHYGEGVTHYSADENTIAVSATDQNGDIAYFSQRDKNLTDIFAQGQNVAVDNVNGTHNVNGTSFAAPKIAGTVTVVQEAAEDIVGHKLSQERMVDLMQMTGTRLIEKSEVATTKIETQQTADGMALGADSQITQLKIGGAFYSGDVVSVNIDGTQYDTTLVIRSGSNFDQMLDQLSTKLINIGSIETISYQKFNEGTNDLYANINVEFIDNKSHDVSISVKDNNPWGNPTQLVGESKIIREAIGETAPEPIKDSPPPPVIEKPVAEVPEPEAPTPPVTEPDTPVIEDPVIEKPVDEIPQDNAGDTFETSKGLGVINRDTILEDFLSFDDDAIDTFRFTIGDNTVNISVETNDNDIDLELYNKQGVMIDNDWNWGGDDVNIHRFLQEGQYYVKVVNFDHDQQTDYRLTFDLNREAPTPEVQPDYAGYVIPDTQKMVDYLGQNYDGWLFV